MSGKDGDTSGPNANDEARAIEHMNSLVQKQLIKMKLRHRPDLRAVVTQMFETGEIDELIRQKRERESASHTGNDTSELN